MNVHLFGAKSSPSCANYCLRRIAEDHMTEFDQETINTVYRNFYMDDCLKSLPSVPAAVDLVSQLYKLLTRGKMELVKWVSNSPEVLKSIPQEIRAPKLVDLDIDSAGRLLSERTLGLAWDLTADTLRFSMRVVQKPLTRRGILAVTSSLYDPLGFVAPVVLPAKAILQGLCRLNLGWDAPVPSDVRQKWCAWLNSLGALQNLTVPRCYSADGIMEGSRIQAHHFADASTVGYAAVTYLRVITAHREVTCSFVMGKSRLCPMNMVSIPRLELTAAVVAVRLDAILRAELDLIVDETFFWTDSTAVLGYINNTNARFKTFVANRLSKIHAFTTPQQWRYVDSKSNPADHGSRGLLTSQQAELSIWLEGPAFLRKEEDQWPRLSSDHYSLPEDAEIKKNDSGSVHAISKEGPLCEFINSHSDWMHLLKSVSWLRRFILHCLRRISDTVVSKVETGPISVTELQESEMKIIQYVQLRSFPHEYRLLKQASSKASSSTLAKLSPILVDEVIRVGGRLERSPLGYDAKHPVILPNKHHVTDLLIRHCHASEGHSGQDHVLASLRGRYWIVHGRSAVRRVLSQCFSCRKRMAPVGNQYMAPLPKDRVQPHEPPFTSVGVDYFGTLRVKQGRSVVLRYGCLFTCLTCRAVHIEIAHSLDTDSFLNALVRFISRRGRPRLIRSDNGTNFVGGERELRSALESWNQKKIHNFLSQRQIKWIFNTPGASHFGGVWERLIRSTKKILKALINEQLLSEESLTTTMAEVERIMNDRPLTPVSTDPRDFNALTPSQLLLLKPNPCLPLGSFGEDSNYCRRRWKQIQYLADLFWRRWIREYLPLLQSRQKWTVMRENMKVGDLVLIADANTKRGEWLLGRISQVNPDEHGVVRSAKVRTSTGTLDRPIHKLCWLESEMSADLRSEKVSTGTSETGPESIDGGAEDCEYSSGVNCPGEPSADIAPNSQGRGQPILSSGQQAISSSAGTHGQSGASKHSSQVPLRRSGRNRREPKHTDFVKH